MAVVTQVREEVAKESGIYIPKQPSMLNPSYLMTDPFFGPPMPPRALNGHLAGQHPDSSGMRDMVSMVSSLYMGECLFLILCLYYLYCTAGPGLPLVLTNVFAGFCGFYYPLSLFGSKRSSKSGISNLLCY